MGSSAVRVMPLWVALGLVFVAARAPAIEFQEGRLQVHGFGEVQLRSIARDYQFSDGWDLTQWYNVLNVELEYDIAPDGWGPFDYLSAYSRIEVRYDCVWSRACGLARSADTYGDRSSVLPGRLSDGRSTSGEFVGGTRVMARTGPLQLPDHRPGDLGVSSLGSLVDATALVGPDLTQLLFGRFSDFRFGRGNRTGNTDGLGSNLIGPFLPENELNPIAEWRDVPNPFSTIDMNPLTGTTGVRELPFRRAPLVPAGPSGSRRVAQGLFYPNADFRNVVGRADGEGGFDQNFREAELKWNRGATQQDEKELKELYVDVEFMDGALWGRIGKQTIVWGKTELFRNQDQFNPQDLALASLPSLEESRVALWSARFVYSFYNVGPLDDVRLELAFNFDQFEPSDLGDCGEPYTPDAVCYLKAQGLFTHGVSGLGAIGEERPPSPWNDLRGLEGGVRLEWRWERFSFAITDFYGYNDSTTSVKYTHFGRNVDVRTGRPAVLGATGGCDPDGLFDGDTSGCLVAGSVGAGNALDFHAANQMLFAGICASTVGVLASVIPTAPADCLQTLFNIPGISFLIGLDLSGIGGGVGSTSLVGLNVDPADGGGGALSSRLTDQQEALLGCGPFYQTSCDDQGLDLLNAEASALFQSWPSFDGLPQGVVFDAPTLSAFLMDPSTPNPGTVGFDGGPVATRLVSDLDSQVFRTLPGARGPGDAGYDPLEDGCVDASVPGCAGANTLVHPFTAQPFRTELGAFSWNLLQTLVALSPAPDPGEPPCAPDTPLGCTLVSSFAGLAGVQNPLVSSRDRRFGRRDFTWHGGSPSLITYDKRNILGFSTDFAEDVTGTNWGIEFTWVNDARLGDTRRSVGTSEVDTYNLTVSVDRPTFITFLNRNRTFFMNAQTFVSYIEGYTNSFASSGPIRVLQTFTMSTGYFQDRLNPTVTFVYDWKSNSGAILPNINYRFTERFRVIFGLGAFFGRTELDPMSITPSSLSNRVGQHRFRGTSEQALSPARNRDEIFLRLRYTF